MCGSSPANQRIEGWWSFYRRNRSTWWINFFKDLIDRDLFHPGNQLEEEALWYCFSGVLQKDLDLVREPWNTHRIRDSKHDTLPGRPDELFLLSECSGGIDGLLFPVSTDEVRYVSDNLLQSEAELNEFEGTIFHNFSPIPDYFYETCMHGIMVVVFIMYMPSSRFYL